MAQKIKSLTITGFRGAKKPLVLPIDGKSALFYGDNGTGKSSIADAIEWFYYDEVKHLSSDEIEKDALRYIGLTAQEHSSVSVGLTKSSLDSSKMLSFTKTKLTTSFSNSSSDFQEYRDKSEGENLLLRYRDLEQFVCSTKTQKLNTLSEIIGYSEVIKTKEIIRKSFTSIKNEIKSHSFEQQQQAQQTILIEKLGCNLFTETQLFEKVNEIIAPLKLGLVVTKMDDLDTVLTKLKSPIDVKIADDLKLLEKVDGALKLLNRDVSAIDTQYVSFYTEFDKIFKDVESIKQVLFKTFLEKGRDVVSSKNYTDNSCPLCLQDFDKEDLKQEIEKRLKEIEASSEKLKELESAKELIQLTLAERVRRIDHILAEPLMADKRFKHINVVVLNLKARLKAYSEEADAKVLSGKMVATAVSLKFKDKDFECTPTLLSAIDEAKKILASDTTSDARVKVEFAKTAFSKILELNKELRVLEKQKESIGLIFTEFIKKQQEGLETFIQTLSGEINEFFQFMNPSKHFEDLEIIVLNDDDGELEGITIQFKFNGEVVSPPKKYFSESYLNCYGLAFFLASVKAFNKENKFFILDDVISSFDSDHRKRFADLLFEKFSDYQILVLTHETEWFSIIKDLAKGKGWDIQEIKWNLLEGTHLEKTPASLKELIEYQISNSIEAQLGNSIRTYLEKFLKQICSNLEVRTVFRFNDQNERRMCPELLSDLKSTIEKKSTSLKVQVPIIERVAGSTTLGNLLSHDNHTSPKIGDLNAFWDDVKIIEGLFTCPEKGCNRLISMKNYDSVTKHVRCGCGKLSYDWK